MTDLLNTALNNLGTKMATNLTTKGVTASANEGLTTLANKILDIITHISYYDDCSGNYSSLWKTNPTYTTYGGYNCLYNNKSLGAIPTSVTNVQIEFDMYPHRSWGGIDVRSADGKCLVFYRNSGQTVNDHGAIVSPKLSQSWHSIKTVINNGSFQCFVDNASVGTGTYNVTGPLYFEGGSNNYPFYLKEIRITEL